MIIDKGSSFFIGGESMPVKIEINENEVVAFLSGEIDHHNAKILRESVDNVVETAYPEVLVLDFGGVTFMDSSGVGFVMGRWKLMQDLRGSVRLVNMPPFIRKVMRMAGIEKLLGEQRKEGHSA